MPPSNSIHDIRGQHNRASNKFPPLRIFLISLLVTTGAAFHYGYQLTLTSPAEEAFVHFVNQSIAHHYPTLFQHGSLDQTHLEVWSHKFE
jgi:hypothetical protein